MTGVDPHDVRLVAVLGAALPVEVELLLERLVGQKRRDGDPPPVLGRELVRPVGGPAEEDPELALGERHDVRVRDLVVLAGVREALVAERGEEQVDRLLVARPRVLVERDAGLLGDPAVPATHPPLVPAAREDVGRGDRRGEHGRVVVRQRVQHGAEADPLRPLRRRGEERRRVRRDRELRKEEVLDRRVAVVPEPVRVLDLLEDLSVELLRRLPLVELHLRVQAEAHRPSLRRCDMSTLERVSHRGDMTVNFGTAAPPRLVSDLKSDTNRTPARLELGALPANVAAADLDRGDRDGVRLGDVVGRRPHAPRAAVVHERRLELRLDAAVRHLGDEDDVVPDLELPFGRALGPREDVRVEQR